MIFGQSIKSVLRTPFKTILFFLLIAAVTVFACMGFGMLSSGNKLIKDADAAYTTKAIVEYIDEGYPDAEKYSDIMMDELSKFDYSVLSDNENVLSFERQYELGGYIEGYSSKSNHNTYGDNGIIRFRYRGMTQYGPSCMVHEPYYKGDSPYNEGLIFYIFFDGHTDTLDYTANLEEGHIYIAHGVFTEGYMSTDAFVVTPYDNPGAPDERLFKYPIWDVTDMVDDGSYMEREEYALFMKMAEAYNVMNNFVSVEPTVDVQSAAPFLMQQTYLLDDGVSRCFTEEEYASNAKSIIISNYIAARMGIKVGDTVKLNLYAGQDDGSFARSSFWPDNAYIESDEYTVVGLFLEGKGVNALAFIPMPTGADSWLPKTTISYTMASIKLKNGSAEQYIQDIDPYMLPAMRISVFDQGYSETIAPIKAMRESAMLLTIVSAVCCLVVLVLFAYLFVAKQKGTASTMVALGTGRARALFYLLLCVLIIAVIASAVGAYIGYHVSEKVTEAAYNRAQETTTVDNRYSAIYMNNEDVDFKLDFAPEIMPIIYVACGITGAALLLSFIVALISLKRSTPKGGVQRGSLLQRLMFSLNLALTSIKRGGAKNVIVPIASLVLVLFIGIFSRQIATSNDKLNDVYDNSSVYAYYTTSNGKRIDTLSLTDEDFAELLKDEHIDETYKSSTRYMQLCGYQKAGSEEWVDKFVPVIPTGSFALETFLNNLVNYDKVVFTNSIRHTPEFLFENEMYITYLEGYSEKDFLGGECICAMPETLMEDLGYHLGDKVSVCVFTSGEEDIDEVIYDATIFASFEKAVSRNNIYMPLKLGTYSYYVLYAPFSGRYKVSASSISPEEIEELKQYYSVKFVADEPYNYNALAFKLKNLRTLNEFKDVLSEMGYSPVGSFGRARTWIVVEDSFLNTSIVNINRHISYMAILFIVVYILAVAIGFVLSYLLTKSRRSELAMMRSMGTGRVRTFNIFFLEQLILSLIGGALGVLIIWLMYKTILPLQWLGFAGYFICYWIGVMISIAVMNRVDVIKILSAKD